MEDLDLTQLFEGRYAGCRVLVTGHTGFKGSWLALWLQKMGAEVAGLALNPDSDPSHWELLGLTLACDTRSDLRDAAAVRKAVAAFRPEIVFHLAAQPLVRRGYREPSATFDTNVGGLVNLLEAVRSCDSVRAMVNATTDKVYESRSAPGGYREDDRLGGSDPYGTSKACAELVTGCYRQSYFLPDGLRTQPMHLATARAGNVIGGGDWGEDRLVPDLVRAAVTGQPLRIRNPLAVRPWQHVLEPLSGYLRIAQSMLDGTAAPDAWNLGPAADATLLVGEVVSRMRQEWPELKVELDRGPHPREAEFLKLDCGKAQRELGWRTVWDAGLGLQRTARWYRAFHDAGIVLTHDDLRAYVRDARAAGQAWAA